MYDRLSSLSTAAVSKHGRLAGRGQTRKSVLRRPEDIDARASSYLSTATPLRVVLTESRNTDATIDIAALIRNADAAPN